MILDEQTGNWQRVRKRIVNYNGNVYKRKTWYNKRRKLYVKVSNYFDSGLYTRITKLVPKAYPGNLVSHHHSDRSMTFTYKPIQGIVLSSWCLQWTEEFYKQVYQWLCDDLDRTWPIVHGDWAPGNIIQNKDGFHLIDYDEIYDAYEKSVSKDLVRKAIHKDIVKGVPYLKLRRNS
tara:strand:+ start:479 stop:1006 length:528 start_codon:yes stop_codon:yes gene_type:complete